LEQCWECLGTAGLSSLFLFSLLLVTHYMLQVLVFGKLILLEQAHNGLRTTVE
jgi:hypothetical protein